MSAQHPNATIQSECYLRDANGKSVRDPVTNERRRVDTAVIENGKADTYEVTSMTADKTDQLMKEQNIRDEGGTFIRDRSTKNLYLLWGFQRLLGCHDNKK